MDRATFPRSAALHERACRVIPGGVSRATLLADPHPLYVASGSGAWVTDVDGHRYLDCQNNYTSIILGHAAPAISEAVAAQLGRGTAFSLATEAELALAELLCDRVPGFERVRFSSSGTEAVMAAIKAARAFTGRPAVAKVEGSYHGTYDAAEVSLDAAPDGWGDAAAPTPVSYAAGTPQWVAAETVVLPYNDADAAHHLIAAHGDRLAAVLVDPLPSRVGMPAPTPEFLEAVTATARAVGALVILDEVITFRLGPAGQQGRLGLRPDLTVLGKIIGGGFPVGAVAGRADVMAVFAPSDGRRALVPTGGTFSANPVTMVAGRACLEQLDDAAFDRLAALGGRARDGLRAAFAAAGVPGQVTGDGSLFRAHPHDRPVRSYRDARHTPREAALMAALYRRLLDRGVYLTPYGMGCVSLATSDADVDHLVDAFADALRAEPAQPSVSSSAP